LLQVYFCLILDDTEFPFLVIYEFKPVIIDSPLGFRTVSLLLTLTYTRSIASVLVSLMFLLNFKCVVLPGVEKNACGGKIC
jgi:hypothetical protein